MTTVFPSIATSFSVKNTFSAREAYIDELNVKKKFGEPYINVMTFIDDKLKNLTEVEERAEKTLETLNKTIQELTLLKKNMTEVIAKNSIPVLPPPVQVPIPPVQIQTMVGKVGPRGLQGAKGDSILKLSQIPDIDTSKLVNGSVLVWNSEKSMWIAQNIFEE